MIRLDPPITFPTSSKEILTQPYFPLRSATPTGRAGSMTDRFCLARKFEYEEFALNSRPIIKDACAGAGKFVSLASATCFLFQEIQNFLARELFVSLVLFLSLVS